MESKQSHERKRYTVKELETMALNREEMPDGLEQELQKYYILYRGICINAEYHTIGKEQLIEEIRKLRNTLKQEQEQSRLRKQMCEKMQENIRRAGVLRSDLIKESKEGKSDRDLLFKAVTCIGLMCGDSLFIHTVQENMKKRGNVNA